MRAPLLGQVAVFAALLALSTCLTGTHLCPRSLDCAQAGRHFCQPGSSHCGPCLHHLVENSHGRCVVKRRHAPHPAQSIKGKVSTYPELDEEIDFLSAIISEQRTVSRLPASPFQDISKSMQLSQSGPAHGASTTEQPTKAAVFTTTVASPTPTTTTTATTTTTTTTNHTPALLDDPIILPYPSNDSVFIIMSSVFIVAGSLALIIAGACWVRLQKGVHLTQKVDYPVYGLMRAQTFDSLPGDKKLAHSAQMYHYQHQKQQMLSLEKHRAEPKVPDSGASTDEENEDGDFTVYECPGLAPTGEMEVKNPLFDDSTLYFQRFHK
ncbi:Neural proliferation differentiation and control protein 1 [Larimichthys crocea]|uniref:Neural proliferation differentiation and control protein 1 n=2 Tax=Larimichthys crocea TaxID=215358 RepID=A0A6G0IJM1_LARCR|nr:neural proliferation differentiation and control protein 1 [Larimichthys crocea]KAE8291574.1 Neural proliferation differentiation and control protein 1 [Larimichthys crocea]TMS04027.1 Neural proliferation differentiation and control protein 1 [Larimichthys crocea]